MTEPDAPAKAPSTIDEDLLDPYEKLVTIEILGKQVDVPEKNRLLRCFQYLSLKSIFTETSAGTASAPIARSGITLRINLRAVIVRRWPAAWKLLKKW